MKKLLLFIPFFGSLFLYSQSQKNKQKNFQTDVFVLNSCSPGLTSFKKDGDNSENTNIKSIRRLSFNVNRFTAFKIENINPLRFNYNLENLYVSQFMDKEEIATGGFIKDTANLSINDIEALQIFSIKDKLSNSKDLLKNIKTRITAYQDTLSLLNADYNRLFAIGDFLKFDFNYAARTYSAKTNNNKKIKDSINNLISIKDREFDVITRKLDNEFDNVNSTIFNSNVNADLILEDIKNITPDSAFPLKRFSHIINAISVAANETQKKLKKLDSALNFVASINDNPNVNFSSNINRLKQLSKNAFAGDITGRIETLEFYSNSAESVSNKNSKNDRKQAIFNLKDFPYNEKIKTAEYFIVFTSLQIGKLLQGQIINCSRFQNELKTQMCIKDYIFDIEKLKTESVGIYNYIQNITSNLNVYINYLQLSNPVFDSTVISINNNYRLLLKFIKTLDFVNKNNCKVFTLPSHNNLKNYDLIRYSIKRMDKLTGKIEPYSYDIWIKGGFKVDFSIAILTSQLTDFTYNKTPFFYGDSLQSKDSFYFRKADNGKYSFAFGGMVNLFWRTGASWLTPGFSFGVAYATTQNLQFLAAGSLQFGKTERIIAHYGISAGLAKRLSLSELTYDRSDKSLYKSNDGSEYLVRGDISNASTPYANRFLFRPFFGISYNLSKKNALNAIGNNGDAYNGAFKQTP